MNIVKQPEIINYEFSKEVAFKPFVGEDYEKGVDLSFFGKQSSNLRQRVLMLGESCYHGEDDDWNKERGNAEEYEYRPDADINAIIQSRSKKMVHICDDGTVLDKDKVTQLNMGQFLPLTDIYPEIFELRKINPEWGKQRKSALFKKSMRAIHEMRDKRIVLDKDREAFWESIAFYEYVQWWLDRARRRPTDAMFSKSDKAFFEVLSVLKPDLIIAWGVRLFDEGLPDAKGEYYGFKWTSKTINDLPSVGTYYCGEYTSDQIGHRAKLIWMYHPSSKDVYKLPLADIIAKAYHW